MTDDTAIKIENLSKCYQIYEHPRHRLLQMFLHGYKTFYREFWALKDVSFEVKRGETIGIIGRNGSGKSTLLQLICGTLNSSGGVIKTNGRIAALLELGSGFNPDFTGQENIYMNASVLGLSKEEISSRFDKITAFADIGDFINQPVKTYSSGMYVRLAFSVLAHVDADIIIIDEALAVGDAIFTQKCMRFLRSFKERGTLIFVSHDMGSVLNLCERVVWLQEGKLSMVGLAKPVTEKYMHYTMQELYGNSVDLQEVMSSINSIEYSTEEHSNLTGHYHSSSHQLANGCEAHISSNFSEANGWNTGYGEIIEVRIETIPPNSTDVLKGGELVRLTIRAKSYQDLDSPILGFLVRDRLGQDLFGENTLPYTALNPRPMASGSVFEGVFIFQMPLLPNGQYSVTASLANGELNNNVQHHWIHEALFLTILSSKVRWGLVGVPFEMVELQKVI